MIEVLKYAFKPSPTRIGYVHVKFHGMVIKCDLCLWKYEKIWLRMPEVWQGDKKKRFMYWQTQEESDMFQEDVLTKLKRLSDLSLEKAIELKNIYVKKIKDTKLQKSLV